MSRRGDALGRSRGNSKEVYGILFLMLGVFLTLCLFSYDVHDPSFTSLATTARRTHNLGGLVGSHLADLIFNLLGCAGFFVPLSLIGLAVTHFAKRSVRIGSLKILAYLGLILFSAILGHLYFREVAFGGRIFDGGGVVGLWLGGVFGHFFGRTGSILLVLSGLLVVIVAITRFSLLTVLSWLHQWARFLGARFPSTWRLCWGRIVKGWDRWQTYLNAWWARRAKSRVRINTPPRMENLQPRVSSGVVPSGAVPLKVVPLKLLPKSPAVIDAADAGPKILPRVDLKENRSKNQLEMVVKTPSEYRLPQLSLLDSEMQDAAGKIDEEGLRMNSRLLERKLLDYGVAGNITEIHPGPIITMYEFVPAPGVKVNKIVNLEDDLAMIMGGKSVRIIAPLPGKAAVGIEIPNNNRETVWVKEIIGHSKFQRPDSKLILALGKDTEGIPFVADLSKMPHLLVAGATGVGKSVALNSMVVSFLYKSTPDDVRFIMIDLKMLELSIYEGIPHLLLPVVTNPKRASQALRWVVSEMERRYEILAQRAARHISGFNKSVAKEDRLPFIVVFIDELADLMMTASRDVEVSITRLAQMARAAGIHLILATQRPSVDVITGLIKANFPARISFKVTSKHDSRTILDTVGAEHLLGSGDMLFMSGGVSNLQRIHGSFVSETEINRVVEHWKQQGTPKYLDEAVLKPLEEEKGEDEGGEDIADELYDQALAIVSETRLASISMIQRRLRIGYNRAARMIERMEKEGVVGPPDGAKAREVYVNNLNDLGGGG